MALWRFGRGWPDQTMKRYLADLKDRKVNFDIPPEEMTPENGWTVDGNDTALGCERPGPPEPDGLFERAEQGIKNYDFSDPRIVEGHFDPKDPFVGRNILLEMKTLGSRGGRGRRYPLRFPLRHSGGPHRARLRVVPADQGPPHRRGPLQDRGPLASR